VWATDVRTECGNKGYTPFGVVVEISRSGKLGNWEESGNIIGKSKCQKLSLAVRIHFCSKVGIFKKLFIVLLHLECFVFVAYFNYSLDFSDYLSINQFY